jgi:hypothetical protein
LNPISYDEDKDVECLLILDATEKCLDKSVVGFVGKPIAHLGMVVNQILCQLEYLKLKSE